MSRKDRLTMHEAILYRLIQNLKGTNEYIPVFGFQGDIYSPELSKGGFMSHECSARLSEINKHNPNLLDWKEQKAKYGSQKYRLYRLWSDFNEGQINDPRLRSFYQSLKVAYEPKPRQVAPEMCSHGLPLFVHCPQCHNH